MTNRAVITSMALAMSTFCGVVDDAAASNSALPLTLTDDRDFDGTITVETAEFAIVFSEFFNGGIRDLYDLSADPGRSDNLATASNGGTYGQGALFDWDFYLGNSPANAYEFMTTMGSNANAGAAVLEILENSAARVRIRQSGHPRLNNGQGPPGDPFPELEMIEFETIWTIYPTGKVAIDFTSTVNTQAQGVDSGAGGGGKSISASGCCGTETIINGAGGVNFITAEVWPGDRISSTAGGWGPIAIAERIDATTLRLASAVPAGSALDYSIRREQLLLETLSIHADGDASIVNQCSDPFTSRWEGGSDGDPLWTRSVSDPCSTLFREGPPPASEDRLLVHWAEDRPAGFLLSMYQPWTTANGGFFNDGGFKDISYTQLGHAGSHLPPEHDRQFLAHIGSSAAAILPSIKSVADASPVHEDYTRPYAEALTGTLLSGAEISEYGFDAADGAYHVSADCNEAVVLLDTNGSDRAGASYRQPILVLHDFNVDDADVVVERSFDGGVTFSALSPAGYNLTGSADEVTHGTGVRVFQSLGVVSQGTASAFRISSQGAGCLTWTAERVKASRIDTPAGDERIQVKGSGVGSSAYDPTTDGFTVRLIAGDQTVWSASVNGGDKGWRSSSRNFKWKSATGPHADGLRTLKIDRPGERTRIKIKATDASAAGLSGATALQIELQIGTTVWVTETSCTQRGDKLGCG